MAEKHDRGCGAEPDHTCAMSCRCWCHIGGWISYEEAEEIVLSIMKPADAPAEVTR